MEEWKRKGGGDEQGGQRRGAWRSLTEFICETGIPMPSDLLSQIERERRSALEAERTLVRRVYVRERSLNPCTIISVWAGAVATN